MPTTETPSERAARRRALEAEARAACERRGHRMHPFVALGDWHPHETRAVCSACGREVTVNLRPMPNEIDIGGEAVALNCDARRY
jgi:hypothetical protein